MDRRLLTLALGMFALGTDNFVFAGVLPQIARSFEVSIEAAGQMTTAYALTYALLAPVFAALMSSVPRKRLLLVALAIFVIANLATALAPSFAFALATRVLAGIGAALFSPTATGSAAALVAPERRGAALSVVIAGLTASTAVGAPLGSMIGVLGDWRWTMAFVATLAALSALGLSALLEAIPMPPPITLAQRLAPVSDVRVGLTLAATLLFMSGVFTVYTYFAVVFDRAIGSDATWLAALMVAWGAAGTFSNLAAGRWIDKVGPRRVLVAMMFIVCANFLALPWTSGSLLTAFPAVFVWGACGWGVTVPQQHRLVSIAPSIAPLLLGLNSTAIYLGVTLAGVVGAAGLGTIGAHLLGPVAAMLVAAALVVSELASRRMGHS
jgi:MFS transporter, DHA1 family, inner membrane transport protein